MSSNHIQMLFYFNLFYGFYLLYILIANLVKKEGAGAILKTITVFAVALIFSALMYADHYMSTREYSKYSTRGASAIVNQSQTQQSTTGGNTKDSDYEYATNWSFSPGEVMTFFIPSWQGFGDIEYKGQRMNAYWGQNAVYYVTHVFWRADDVIGFYWHILQFQKEPHCSGACGNLFYISDTFIR